MNTKKRNNYLKSFVLAPDSLASDRHSTSWLSSLFFFRRRRLTNAMYSASNSNRRDKSSDADTVLNMLQKSLHGSTQDREEFVESLKKGMAADTLERKRTVGQNESDE